MPIQKQRDPKNSLRFYITLPEAEVASVSLKPPVSLRILDAEKTLARVKKLMANTGAEHILRGSKKLQSLLPGRSHGEVKAHFEKRAKAGTTPAHYRVGLQITFTEPRFADTFAKAIGL
jgi:hypothetical protein